MKSGTAWRRLISCEKPALFKYPVITMKASVFVILSAANNPGVRSFAALRMTENAALRMTENATLRMTENVALRMTENATLRMTENVALRMTAAGFGRRFGASPVNGARGLQ
jgi:hypothetical protein